MMYAFSETQALADRLGDPLDESLCFSFAHRIKDDEAGDFPTTALQQLNDWGLQAYYVPEALGGRFTQLGQLGQLLRELARRDLTLAIGHGVGFLGSMPIWIAGSKAQQVELAQLILGGERSSLALTESGVGSDLLNIETRAETSDGGYELRGSKWLVNGLDRNRLVTIYARTNSAGGARGFSLFLIDKHQVPGAFKNSQRLSTLGVRAADLSSADIHTWVPNEARIGAVGSGFEIVLKGLQLTRLLCGSLALGALDTALATTLRFALARPIYQRRVADIPQTQRLLAESFADRLWMDAVNELAQRAIQFVPNQAIIHSALVKYLVPVVSEQAIARLAVVLGARYYLRDQHEHGIFQKMLRDNLLISLFDGSTQVNLHVLSHQLRNLAKVKPQAIPAWINPDIPAPSFNWDGLALATREESFIAALPGALDQLHTWSQQQVCAAELLTLLIQNLEAALTAWRSGVDALTPAQLQEGVPGCFDLARQYCLLAGIGAFLCQWLANPERHSALGKPEVVALILAQASAALGKPVKLPAQVYPIVFSAFLEDQGHISTDCPTLNPLW